MFMNGTVYIYIQKSNPDLEQEIVLCIHIQFYHPRKKKQNKRTVCIDSKTHVKI